MKRHKYCPRCRKETRIEFDSMLQCLNREQLITLAKGLKDELDKKGEKLR